MIRTFEHAELVQRRRREAGLLGRSKAVRRWFKRTYGRAPEAYGRPLWRTLELSEGEQSRRRLIKADVRLRLRGNFEGCRPFDVAHAEQAIFRRLR